MDWQELNYWNQNSYGSAFKVRRSALLVVAILVCVVTPFTNWAIPVLPRLIKKDLTVRYE